MAAIGISSGAEEQTKKANAAGTISFAIIVARPKRDAPIFAHSTLGQIMLDIQHFYVRLLAYLVIFLESMFDFYPPLARP